LRGCARRSMDGLTPWRTFPWTLFDLFPVSAAGLQPALQAGLAIPFAVLGRFSVQSDRLSSSAVRPLAGGTAGYAGRSAFCLSADGPPRDRRGRRAPSPPAAGPRLGAAGRRRLALRLIGARHGAWGRSRDHWVRSFVRAGRGTPQRAGMVGGIVSIRTLQVRRGPSDWGRARGSLSPRLGGSRQRSGVESTLRLLDPPGGDRPLPTPAAALARPDGGLGQRAPDRKSGGAARALPLAGGSKKKLG